MWFRSNPFPEEYGGCTSVVGTLRRGQNVGFRTKAPVQRARGDATWRQVSCLVIEEIWGQRALGHAWASRAIMSALELTEPNGLFATGWSRIFSKRRFSS